MSLTPMTERRGSPRPTSTRVPGSGRRSIRLALLALAALACLTAATDRDAIVVPEGAAGSAVFFDGADRVHAQLLVHPDSGAAGARVGVLLRMAPGWHVYGPDPGDSGIATQLRFSADHGAVGAVHWPPVETFAELDGLLTTFGYSDEVLLGAAFAPTAGSEGLAGELAVEVDVLACNVECVPASFRLHRDLGALDPSGASAEATRRVFARFAPGLPAPARAEAGTSAAGLLAALGFAFLGGLLLNLMPCVLPVLAIKLVGLAEIGRHERSAVLAHAAAYALGVLATLLSLGGLVAALRAAGTAVGWGFQFQEPLFVAAVATLLVVLALNFFGVFELQVATGRLASVGAQAAGARRSFFEGLLVVLLATPCTAPFLGTAVGFAFASPAPVIFAIFGSIGCGLALPYVLIAVAPGWSGWLPRSGAWMLQLRTGLGFVLLATTVWLLWIFGRSAGSDAASALLALLVAVAASVWALAAIHRAGRLRLARSAGIALIAAVAMGLLWLDSAVEPRAAVASEAADGWQPYDPDAVADYLAGGHPVFVAFSADWCITCKLNERTVLASEAVRTAFADSGAALFLADWTRRDESIRAELARFDRAGVPLYLVYSPLAPEEPAVLPELLRIGDVLAALSAATDPQKVSGITRPSPHASM